ALDLLRATRQLREVRLVRGVVRPDGPCHDERRGMTAATKDRGRVDRRFDALASREPHREQQQRIRVEEPQALREAHPGRRETEHLTDIDPVGDDLDVISGEPGELRELLRSLLRHGDIADAWDRTGDEVPWRAVATHGGVALVEVRDVVRPGDETARTL